jgi:hypothetical protein
VFLALALIAAACGSDAGDGSVGSQTTIPAEPEPDAEPEPEVAPDSEVDAEPEVEPELEVDEPESDDESETEDTGSAETESDDESETEDTGSAETESDDESETEDTGSAETETETPTGDSATETETDDTETDTGTDDTGAADTGTDAEGDTGTGDTGTDTGTGDTGTDTGTDGEGDSGTGDTGTDGEGDSGTDTGTDGEGDSGTGDTGADGEGDSGTDDSGTDDTGTDDTGTDGADDTGEPEPEGNATPTFDEGDSAARNVDEGTPAGEPVGDPVKAGDADGDTLIYSLEGADAASFAIDWTTGQIRTRAALDRDAQAVYTLTVAVTDGKDAAGGADTATDATIEVTINVDAVIVAEFATLTVYLQGDTTTPVTSVDGPGQWTFTVVGRGWTGLHSKLHATPAGTINNPSLFLTTCLVPGQGGLDFFRQCDSEGMHTFAGVTTADPGSQELSSLYVSDTALRELAATTINIQLAALNVGADGSFRLDMTVDVPAGGVIINAAIGEVSLPHLMSSDLIIIGKAVTVEISA